MSLFFLIPIDFLTFKSLFWFIDAQKTFTPDNGDPFWFNNLMLDM